MIDAQLTSTGVLTDSLNLPKTVDKSNEPYKYVISDHVFELAWPILKNMRGGTTKIMSALIEEAVEHAREMDPDCGVIELALPQKLINLLKPLLKEHLANQQKIYVVFGFKEFHEVIKNPDLFDKGPAVNRIGEYVGSNLGGDNVITAHQKNWVILQPPMKAFLGGDVPLKQAKRLNEEMQKLFKESGSETVNLTTHQIRGLMFKTIGRLVAPNYNPTPEELEHDLQVFEASIQQFSDNLQTDIFASEEQRLLTFFSIASEAAMGDLRTFFTKLQGFAKHDTPESSGFITYIKEYRENLPEDQKEDWPYDVLSVLQSNSIGLFEAGSKTVTQMINYCLVILDQNPEVQENLRNLILQAENPDLDDTLTKTARKEMDHILNSIILEAARYSSPIWLTYRENTQETQINGKKIDDKSINLLYIRGLLHNPKLFSEPEKLILNREGNSKGMEAWLLPGDRACIGYSSSLQLAKEFIKTILRNKRQVKVIHKGIPSVDATYLDDFQFELLPVA